MCLSLLSELSPPLITVITPCLQAAATLPETLKTIVDANSRLNLAGESLEHIVIDGGSTDGTQELLECHSSTYPFCQWKRVVGGGPYRAMNLGLKMARGHYSHILNADDLLFDPIAYADFLIESRRTDAALLLSSIGYFRRPKRRLQSEWIVHQPPTDFWTWQKQLQHGLHYPHPGFIALTTSYQQIGFDEKYHLSADYKLMQTLLLRPELARKTSIHSRPLVAMAEGGATSGWKAILCGMRQLAEINQELGINASAWSRYLRKFWRRFVRRSSCLPLPSCDVD